MVKHYVRNTFEMQETDRWVNDATRADLQVIAEKNGFNVFGLKCWTWQVTEATKLGSAPNFSVDYVFANDDKTKVDAVIAEYQREIAKGYNSNVAWKCVNALAEITLKECVWT